MTVPFAGAFIAGVAAKATEVIVDNIAERKRTRSRIWIRCIVRTSAMCSHCLYDVPFMYSR